MESWTAGGNEPAERASVDSVHCDELPAAMSSLLQLRDEQLKGPFETVAQLARSAKRIIEGHGVRLLERSDHDEAGPIRAAAVALDDGSQFLVVEHYAHPDEFLDLRAQTSAGTAKELTERFANAAGLSKRDITWVSGE